ncbi:hypothetical protein AMAG_11052 [Allomyces macrogynus ATCC 38327]|uniref:B30.2/SPRY domain-containing protein n=1 Tax=Allomyces macrogynus (strain ATCC 38327) TaxID=578462 RepID=A0A0L0SSD5_ALLM3|nr:hypothetical protein AMAG_11052 [Allomyces macrogynus ATCC 38327]|eukprot:KNE65422.1 hypothetical protein AMAG_11052 [Allomyces macrogynus ATCC 38327]
MWMLNEELPQWINVLLILALGLIVVLGPAGLFYAYCLPKILAHLRARGAVPEWIAMRRSPSSTASARASEAGEANGTLPTPTSDLDREAARFHMELVKPNLVLDTESRFRINEHGPLAWEFLPPTMDRANPSHIHALVRNGTTLLFMGKPRTIQTQLPIPTSLHFKNTFYFEVTVNSKPGGSLVSIGLAPRKYPEYMLGPGWVAPSVGFRSDGKKFVDGRSGTTGTLYGEVYTGGDVIGCGFNAARGSVFFTKNGRALDAATDEIPADVAMFPTIGATRGVFVDVNFGQEPFKFKQANQYNLGFMTDLLPTYDVTTLANDPDLEADSVVELPRAVVRWSLNSYRSMPPEYDGEVIAPLEPSLPRSVRSTRSQLAQSATIDRVEDEEEGTCDRDVAGPSWPSPTARRASSSGCAGIPDMYATAVPSMRHRPSLDRRRDLGPPPDPG